jgi:hypothetical protein
MSLLFGPADDPSEPTEESSVLGRLRHDPSGRPRFSPPSGVARGSDGRFAAMRGYWLL